MLITDWTPLPMPRAWYDDKPKRQWSTRRDHYAAIPKRLLTIIAEPVTPVIESEPGAINLDSLLSYAAITTHPTETMPVHDIPAIIPLPIALAWISPAHQPLWASTPLRPVGPEAESREYWHKRHPADRADWAAKPSVNTRAGRWKEYRQPVRGKLPSRYAALAIGHRAEIERLLTVCTHIGKKASMGYGRIGRWTVIEQDADPVIDDILAQRPVPIAYYAGKPVPPGGIIAPNRAWTPPYWYAPWWADCISPTTQPER